jgi:hypothetical protein
VSLVVCLRVLMVDGMVFHHYCEIVFSFLGNLVYVDYHAPMQDINKRVTRSVLTSLVLLSSWCTR